MNILYVRNSRIKRPVYQRLGGGFNFPRRASLRGKQFSKKSFTLVEVLVGVFLMLIVFVGIFGAYRLGLKVVGQSKASVSALAIANAEIEKLRNLDYPDVKSEEFSTTSNNVVYNVETIVQCVDDEKDGKGENDEKVGGKSCLCDYKKVKVKVSWSGIFGGEVSLTNIISPRNKTEECEELAGVLAVSVFNAKGEKVGNPSIEVRDINTGKQYWGYKYGDVYEFVLPPATSTYGVTTTKSDPYPYTISRTYKAGEVYNGQTIVNPENNCYAQPLVTILNAQREERSFCIDKVSKFLIHTLQAKAKHIYYVRKVGSDSNDGLSPDTAFLTIQKAASVAEAGDFVFIGAGNYEEKVEIQNSGKSDDEPIAFVADIDGTYTGDKGEVKISGRDIGFYIDGKKYIKIYGFKIENTTGTAGIYIQGSTASNIELVDDDISDNTGDGIRLEGASDVVISHNSISSNATRGIYLDNANSAQIISNTISQNLSLGISNNGSGSALIKFNRIFSNGGKGILIFNNANNNQIKNNVVYSNFDDGIQIYHHVASIEVMNNKSYSNSGNGIAFRDDIKNTSKIISNLVYLNQGSGILLSDHCVNNKILNNTSFRNSENGILIELSSDNNKIKDNIVASSTLAGIKVSSSTNIDVSYNDVWANSPDYDGISSGTGSISVDPLFVDPDGSDNILGGDNGKDDSFHLSQVSAEQATTSPCVDAGSDSASDLELASSTTRTDNVSDSGIVDLGFHYSLESPPSLAPPPDPFGLPIANTQFHLRGEKIVGKDASDNPIYKYSATSTTDSQGELTLSDMEWDNYYFSDFVVSNQSSDLIISFPSLMPIYLPPGSTTTVKLGLKAENSLSVKTIDASTSEPVAFSQVRVYKSSGYDQTKISDEDGKTYFIPLTVGTYNIEAVASGYATSTTSTLVSGDVQKTIPLSRL